MLRLSIPSIIAVFLISSSILGACQRRVESFPSSQSSFSDEYLGRCFIRRSPLASEWINSRLPEVGPDNSEAYLEALTDLSDEIGAKLFDELRAIIVELDDEQLDRLHSYCDRELDATDDMFFQLERIVYKNVSG